MEAKTNFDSQWSKQLRRAAFRRAFFLAACFASGMLLLTGFIYWQSVVYFRRQIDRHLLADTKDLAADPPQIAVRLAQTLSVDPRLARIGGLFDKDGNFIAGNVSRLPTSSAPLAEAGVLSDIVPRDKPLRQGTFRGVIMALPGGSHLVFGRRANELAELDEIVSRALGLALIPLLLLATLAGILLSRTTMLRVEAVEYACRRIMTGRLEERLPVSSSQNEFDILSLTVNRMLEEIQRLMTEVKTAGDAIAHDLRTPLTRLNARLDRILNETTDSVTLRSAIERTVIDVGQLLTMTRAVLRLGEIESGQRRSGFKEIDLSEVIRSIHDFYSAIAEEKQIMFFMECPESVLVSGDGELLFEAIANLVDNAIKFTPIEGKIRLTLISHANGSTMRIDDTGPGIPFAERTAVLRRFYRSDPSRHLPGVGMGLALVAAIARLHNFTLTLSSTDHEQGCRVDLFIPTDLHRAKQSA